MTAVEISTSEMPIIPSEFKIDHSHTLTPIIPSEIKIDVPSEFKIAHSHSVDNTVLLGAAFILALGGIYIYYIKGTQKVGPFAFYP